MLFLLAAIITFIVVIGIHEAGHAVAARFFGVKIQRISIGFGKPILSWSSKKGTEWALGRWPLGGYVKLLNSRIDTVTQAQYPLCFDKQPISARCIILLAGGLANVLLAWIGLTMVYSIGFKQYEPVIAEVKPESVMAQAGFLPGDRFLAIEGRETHSWMGIGMEIVRWLGHEKVSASVINADGQKRIVNLDLQRLSFQGKKDNLLMLLGLKANVEQRYLKQIPPLPIHRAILKGFQQVGYWFMFFLVLWKQLLTGVLPFSLLLGPLGLLFASGGYFAAGFVAFTSFLALLSLAVGIVNLLPIPGLDGGSIVYAIIEKFRGKPFSVALEILLYRLALIVFFLVLIQLILNDLERYFAPASSG